MYCLKCAKEVADDSRFCPECGVQLDRSSQPSPEPLSVAIGTRDQTRPDNLVYPKNPPLSPHLAWLALVQVGIPHIVFGQVAKGIVLIVAFWISMPTVLGPLAILVAAIVDAYRVGNALKAGKPVKKWAFFPKS